MRAPSARALAALSASLSLLAAGCAGGGGGTGGSAGPTGCRITVAGAQSEQLWCVVTAIDWSAIGTSTVWAFELVAYRGAYPPVGTPEIGATATFALPVRPASTPASYGWAAASPTGTSSVQGGSAIWYEPGGATEGYQSVASSGTNDPGVGSLAATLTAIPPADATGDTIMDVHGSLSGTLPPVLGAAGAPVTISATF